MSGVYMVGLGCAYLARGEEMAAFDRLKDVGVEVGLGWQVGLGQRLLHPLDLHQTQSPVLSWGRQQQRSIRQPQRANHHRGCVYYTDTGRDAEQCVLRARLMCGLRGGRLKRCERTRKESESRLKWEASEGISEQSKRRAAGGSLDS